MVSKFEAAKDTAQVLTESAAGHVGRIATIVTGAVRDVARELGDWATDAFEMREATRRATRTDPEAQADALLEAAAQTPPAHADVTARYDA